MALLGVKSCLLHETVPVASAGETVVLQCAAPRLEPRGRASWPGAQRGRPASSRSQAATACSSLRASRWRAARAWLAVMVLAAEPADPGRGNRPAVRDGGPDR